MIFSRCFRTISTIKNHVFISAIRASDHIHIPCAPATCIEERRNLESSRYTASASLQARRTVWKTVERELKEERESTCCLPTSCRSHHSCTALGHHSNNNNNNKKAANTAGLAGLSSLSGRRRRRRGSAAHSESTHSRSKLASVIRKRERERESAAMQCSLCVCSRVEWLLLTLLPFSLSGRRVALLALLGGYALFA